MLNLYSNDFRKELLADLVTIKLHMKNKDGTMGKEKRGTGM